jgi:hypothetical protein
MTKDPGAAAYSPTTSTALNHVRGLVNNIKHTDPVI